MTALRLRSIAWEAVGRHAAGANAGRVAIRWHPAAGTVRAITYRELDEASCRFANLLRGLGVGRGDVVFVLCGRVPELYFAVLGALRLGAAVSPLFSAFGPEPIATRINMGGGKVLVTTEALHQKKVAKIAVPMPTLEHVLLVDSAPFRADFAAASPRCAVAATTPEDTSFLHFTSGTTGMPKGAVHAHGAVVMHCATGKTALDLHAGDVFWCTADPGWVTGTSYGIVTPLVHGVTSIVDEADFDAERWWALLEEERITNWYTAPTAVRMLMKAGADLARKRDLSALRIIAISCPATVLMSVHKEGGLTVDQIADSLPGMQMFWVKREWIAVFQPERSGIDNDFVFG